MARDRMFIRKLVNNPMRYYLLNRLKYSSYVPLQNRVNLPVADIKHVSTSTQTVPVLEMGKTRKVKRERPFAKSLYKYNLRPRKRKDKEIQNATTSALFSELPLIEESVE